MPPPLRPTRPRSRPLTPRVAALLLTLLGALPGVTAQERRPEAEQDVVTLRSGKQYEGQVAYSDDTQVVVRKRSRETLLERAEVELIDSRVAHLHQVLETLEARGPILRQSPDELLEMAAYAEHSRLPGEARLLRLAVLLGDPDHVQANEELDNSVRRKQWHTKRGKTWVPNDELDDPPEGWKHRWTLHTAHYELRTNLGLRDAIPLAFDLERLQRAVYALIGPVVQLREPWETLIVQLHDDASSFPEPGSGRPGQFTTDDRIAFATSTRARWRTYLFHEVVRQLLYVTSERAVNGRGRVPRWLSTGLAEAFAWDLAGPPGAIRFDPLSPARQSHETHARHPQVFELKRVLVFTDNEMDVRDEYQALRYAQCATLVQYLLAGDAELHREGFEEFLRSCWRGQSTPGHLEDALGLDLDDVDDSWHAAVQRIGGP